MKVLFFCDIHGKKEKAESIARMSKGADLLVCAGDLSVGGEGFGEIIGILAKAGKTMLLIPGNNETPDFISEAVDGYENIIMIHDDVYEDRGISFLGVGGGTPSPWNTPFELSDEQLGSILSKHKEKVTVLVSHTPPKDTPLDITSNGLHIGSFSVGEWITKKQPKLCCCGHVHEDAGKEYKLGKTLCFNPGPEGRIIEL